MTKETCSHSRQVFESSGNLSILVRQYTFWEIRTLDQKTLKLFWMFVILYGNVCYSVWQYTFWEIIILDQKTLKLYSLLLVNFTPKRIVSKSYLLSLVSMGLQYSLNAKWFYLHLKIPNTWKSPKASCLWDPR